MNGHEEPASREPSMDELVSESKLEESRAARLREHGYKSINDLFAAAQKQARESALSKPTWTDLEEALSALASEDHVARRLESLRARAGLSQEQLAKRLEELGVHMPQSSISKIEGPMRTGAGKRRDITVDEALALAK